MTRLSRGLCSCSLSKTLSSKAVPVNCSTSEQRAEREVITKELLIARSHSTDETERQRLLEEVVEINLEIPAASRSGSAARGVEEDDLEQVACLGLMKAVRGYRLDDGVPFIGYAVPTIRGEVKRYFRDCSWTVRIPRRLQELQGRIAGVLPQLEQELGREPTSRRSPPRSASRSPRSARPRAPEAASPCCPSTGRPGTTTTTWSSPTSSPPPRTRSSTSSRPPRCCPR